MTTDEKRIAIAKAAGWTDCLIQRVPNGDLLYGQMELPQFTRDLNAMHIVEGKLLKKGVDGDWTDYDAYRNELVRVVGEECIFNCNAQQRADAFIYVMKLGNPYQTSPLNPNKVTARNAN